MYMAQIRHLPNASALQLDSASLCSSNQKRTVTSQGALWVCAGNLDKGDIQIEQLVKMLWQECISASTFQVGL